MALTEKKIKETLRRLELFQRFRQLQRTVHRIAFRQRDAAAVAEETVRLRSHIRQARENCEKNEPVGRSLDFIVQEMNREVNTVSSKSQDIPITQAVIACKSAIEKLREQLQNVE